MRSPSRLWGKCRSEGAHFVNADAARIADRWPAIDLLNIGSDPHTEQQMRQWFDLHAYRCHGIALYDMHHPNSGVRAALRQFVARGSWTVFEYWGNHSAWTVLTRPGKADPALRYNVTRF
jgi:hypothetical protein